jgi:shikimate dehydrogenase
VLLGAGGAARAVLDALLDAGVPEVRLANRTRARAEALAEVFGSRVTVWALDAPGLCAGAVTVVNATTLGMEGAGGFSLPLDGLEPGALATDLIYAPLDTPFLQAARARGCVTVDGLGMLLHQGAPGFARWFGAMPEVTEALREAVLAA